MLRGRRGVLTPELNRELRETKADVDRLRPAAGPHIIRTMNPTTEKFRHPLPVIAIAFVLLASACGAPADGPAPAERVTPAEEAAAPTPESRGPVAATPAEPLPKLRTNDAGAVLVSQAEVLRLLDAGTAPLILDVRTPEEFAEGHVPGAVNISHDELAARLAEVEGARDNGVIVYCRSGRRAATAEELLLGQGFQNVQHLEGDILAWLEAQHPVER